MFRESFSPSFSSSPWVEIRPDFLFRTGLRSRGLRNQSWNDGCPKCCLPRCFQHPTDRVPAGTSTLRPSTFLLREVFPFEACRSLPFLSLISFRCLPWPVRGHRYAIRFNLPCEAFQEIHAAILGVNLFSLLYVRTLAAFDCGDPFPAPVLLDVRGFAAIPGFVR